MGAAVGGVEGHAEGVEEALLYLLLRDALAAAVDESLVMSVCTSKVPAEMFYMIRHGVETRARGSHAPFRVEDEVATSLSFLKIVAESWEGRRVAP